MINHIDVSSVLRRTVCDLYSNLVTRPTGAAVRTEIENLLSSWRGPSLTVIDFSHVNLLDFSCADEVVAKLLIRYADDSRPHDAYFLFRGVSEHHWDAIEAVLERHGLALAIEQEDGVQLMGVLSDVERRAWNAAYRLGKVDAADVAAEIDTSVGIAQETLDGLAQRRLVMCADGEYVAIGRNHG